MYTEILKQLRSSIVISNEINHRRLGYAAPITPVNKIDQAYCEQVCGLIRAGQPLRVLDRMRFVPPSVITTILRVAIEYNRIDVIEGVFNNFILGGKLGAHRRDYLLACFLDSNSALHTALELNNTYIFQYLIVKFINAYHMNLRVATASQSMACESMVVFLETANQIFQQLLLISAARKDSVACAQFYQYPHCRRAIEPMMDIARRAFIDPDVQNTILTILLPQSPQDVASAQPEGGNKQLEEMLRQSLFAPPQVEETTSEEMERIKSILQGL